MDERFYQMILFANEKIPYIENLKDSTKKLLEQINGLSKVAEYKVAEYNIQNLVSFSYANSELTEREIKKTIPFKIATKRIKYIGTNPLGM